MPGLSGQDLADRLHGPRLIALTGDIFSIGKLRHLDTCLTKPVDTEALIAAIRGSIH